MSNTQKHLQLIVSKTVLYLTQREHLKVIVSDRFVRDTHEHVQLIVSKTVLCLTQHEQLLLIVSLFCV